MMPYARKKICACQGNSVPHDQAIWAHGYLPQRANFLSTLHLEAVIGPAKGGLMAEVWFLHSGDWKKKRGVAALLCVSIVQGYYSKVPNNGCVKKQSTTEQNLSSQFTEVQYILGGMVTDVFSQFCQLEFQDRVRLIQCLLQAVFLTFPQQSSCHVLTWISPESKGLL